MKRTNSYIVSLDHYNKSHGALYNELRLITYLFNKTENTNFRVARCGRLGKNNPNAVLYANKVDGRHYTKIRVGDAASFDIYVHNRRYLYNRNDNKLHTKLNAMLKGWANSFLASH